MLTVRFMNRHATLPPWPDQSSDEKLETLRLLIDDLYRYSMRDAFADMRQTLRVHAPADDKEANDIARIITLMHEHATIFSPLCEVGHFTGSALVVDPTSRRVLLHYHKSLHRWLQFGGHPDDETEMAQVAMREAREETGLADLKFLPHVVCPKPIDIDVHTIPATATRPEHIHLDLRYVLTTSTPDAIHVAAGESNRLRWFSANELQDATLQLDLALQRLINKGLQRLSGAM